MPATTPRDTSLPPLPPGLAAGARPAMNFVAGRSAAPVPQGPPPAAPAPAAPAPGGAPGAMPGQPVGPEAHPGLGYAHELLIAPEGGLASILAKVARILAADRKDLLPYVQKMATIGQLLTQEIETSMSQGAQGPEALAPQDANNSGGPGGGSALAMA